MMKTYGPRPPDPAEFLRRRLIAGEVVRWSGRPSDEHFRREGRNGFLVAIGVACFGVLVFCALAFGAFAELVGSWGAVAAAPVRSFAIVVGLAYFAWLMSLLAVKTFEFARRARAARLAYAVTNLRALVVKSGLDGVSALHSYGPDDLRELKIRNRKGSGGDIEFEGLFRLRTRSGDRSTDWSEDRAPLLGHHGFFGIPDVDAARDAIKQIEPCPYG